MFLILSLRYITKLIKRFESADTGQLHRAWVKVCKFKTCN
jgi:hypothetical protein